MLRQLWRTRDRWRRWRTLTSDERWLVLRSLALLVKAFFALSRTQWLPAPENPAVSDAEPRESCMRDQLARAHRIAHLVALAAAACPVKVACLHRSWVLWQLLGKEGIPCSLRIGVRQDLNQAFGAHAWVECQGEALHEAGDLNQQFSAFSASFVPAPR